MDSARLLQLAKDHHQCGRLAEAEHLYREVLSLMPSGPQQGHVWYLIGVVCHAQAKHGQAVESFRHAVEVRPDFGHAHYHLGITLAEMGQHNEAEERFRAALAVKPDFADCWGRLGDALAAQGKFDQAEVAYRQALHWQPGGMICLALASTLYRLNRVEEALAAFQEAAKLAP